MTKSIVKIWSEKFNRHFVGSVDYRISTGEFALIDVDDIDCNQCLTNGIVTKVFSVIDYPFWN